MENQKSITLNLTLEEVNNILTALGNRPYVEVFELVQKVQLQAKEQVEKK